MEMGKIQAKCVWFPQSPPLTFSTKDAGDSQVIPWDPGSRKPLLLS